MSSLRGYAIALYRVSLEREISLFCYLISSFNLSPASLNLVANYGKNI
jgi:hypothetical protein